MTRTSLIVGGFFLFVCCGLGVANGQTMEPQTLQIEQQWSGDFPVSELGKLPVGQQQAGVGYIGDETTFTNVWQAFMAEQAVPAIDFGKQLVVFSRNVDFYNRTNIFKVTLTGGVAEVLAMETMSAIPIEDKVAMAMAVVSRNGIRALKVGKTETIPIQ